MVETDTTQLRTLTAEDYDRAAWHLSGNQDRYLPNGTLSFTWLPDREHFWYRRAHGSGRFAFSVVDAATGAQWPAFDADRVAAALSRVTGDTFQADTLPFRSFSYVDDDTRIRVEVGGRTFLCHTCLDECVEAPRPKAPAAASGRVSPDRKWIASVEDNNVWLSSTVDSERIQITADGAPLFSYGTSSGNHALNAELIRMGVPVSPSVVWSPDSSKLLVQRMDERGVGITNLVQSCPPDGSPRPRTFAWARSLPIDPEAAVARSQLLVYDLDARALLATDLAPQVVNFTSMIESGEAWWSDDGANIYALDRDRYRKRATLHAIDPATGISRTIIEEAAATYIMPAMMGGRQAFVLANGDILWLSERDGWRHLYLYAPTGQVVRQLTQGEWTISRVCRVDAISGEIYFSAGGRELDRDPYFQHLYACSPTGDLRLLTPEDAHHCVLSGPLSLGVPETTFSPSGRFFIDSYSRPDLPPVHTLRQADGALVKVIAHSTAVGWRGGDFPVPTRFTAHAADGATPLYGTIFKPSTFQEDQHYPVLDAVYPGPQITCSAPTFLPGFVNFEPQAFAELGFIVVTMDGRGTPGRSKAFLDASYGALKNPGNIEDHIAVLTQLAQSDPAFDLGRVGVYGYSGGGFAALRSILEAPQFYKIAISGSGNHSQAGYISHWADTFNGPDDGANYLELANEERVASLRGKLFLFHGEMDANVQPAHTLRVVNALIKHNKDFDLLIVPNGGHLDLLRSGYVLRRCWDFVVRNLLGANPPDGYLLPDLPPF